MENYIGFVAVAKHNGEMKGDKKETILTEEGLYRHPNCLPYAGRLQRTEGLPSNDRFRIKVVSHQAGIDTQEMKLEGR